MIKNHVIVPHLSFNTQAIEAAEFYCSIFPNSKIISKNPTREIPTGEYISFKLWGQRFEAKNSGLKLAINPSISFMINFDPLFFKEHDDPEKAARNKMTDLWKNLRVGGQVLMELGEYDFSKYYGWIQDRYGTTWQLILTDPGGDPRPSIMPSMLFVGKNCGKAEEAGNFYQMLFPLSQKGLLVFYPPGMEPEKEDTIMFSDFKLGDTWITASDSAYDHKFQFNKALSFIIHCKDQNEIDYFRSKLSMVPEIEQSGWLEDKYGVSWQIVLE